VMKSTRATMRQDPGMRHQDTHRYCGDRVYGSLMRSYAGRLKERLREWVLTNSNRL